MSDCFICLENLDAPITCERCQKNWCSRCNTRMIKCPFCRFYREFPESWDIISRELYQNIFSNTLEDPERHHLNLSIYM